jgi:hypothetical protein
VSLDHLQAPGRPVVSLLRGPPCPSCGEGEGGIEHQAGLHQDPIIQCLHCLARIFVGVDGFRRAIPEDKAPAVRASFLTPRPFDAGLDGLNRQIADYEGAAVEHERKAMFWRRRVAEAKARRLHHLGLADSASAVAGVNQSGEAPAHGKEEVAKGGGA